MYGITVTQQKFKRYNFSLTEQVSTSIDQLSLAPREFRSTRSDVIKAAISVFSRLPEKEQIEELRKISQ